MSFIPNLDKIRNGANFLADYVRRALEAIQARIALIEFGPIHASRLDWTGAGPIPSGNIPWNDAPAGAGSQFINCLDIYRDGVCQYRDDKSLFFGPGHILHRGLFKRQSCNDDDTWVSALAASLVIPDECPVLSPNPSGLDSDTWYYVYWKLDVAGEGPEYRISKKAPVRCPGYGPEHSDYEKLRFVGSFRTNATGNIKPFHRYANGWVFWRDIIVGPREPDYDLMTVATGGYISLPGLDKWVPPGADAVKLTHGHFGVGDTFLRMKGDIAADSGYYTNDDDDAPGYEIPLGAMDTTTNIPTNADVQINCSDARDDVGVAAYHEALL